MLPEDDLRHVQEMAVDGTYVGTVAALQRR